MKSDWQVQEAKAELSALLQAAQASPQVITRHGSPFAVVLSYTDYQRLKGHASRPRLVDFFRAWPELEISERDATDFGRDVSL